MRIWKRLLNPFVLAGQGFVLGGILFFATHDDKLQAAGAADRAVEAVSALR